jgi:membrane fusion protein (multidrug efflux system)
MSKRMVLMLAGMVAFLAVISTVKFKQVQTAIAQASAFQPPPEAVTTLVAKEEHWPSTLSAIGTVVAVHGVTVSADLPGVVDTLPFDSGRAVAAGAPLASLDTRQERAQLAAAEAQRELAQLSLERVRGLRDQGIVAAAEFDRVLAEHKQAEARVGEIRATIERKQVRAPFAGILGLRQANLGQYLKAGDPIVSLQSLQPIYVDFSVPQQQVGELRLGREVQVAVEGLTGPDFTGRLTAVDSIVDEATRNVRAQATFDNPQGRLRPGMFVETRVILGASRAVIALPASAISYAPYGDSVFVVAEMEGPGGQRYQGVRQQFVKLGGALGDQVAVLSGVETGTEVVTSGAFKLRNGAAVRVNNDVQPGNDPAPKPEDN